MRFVGNELDLLVLSELRRDARGKLTVMSRRTGVPVSTLFDRIKAFRKTRDGSLEGEWLPMNETLTRELLWWWNNRKFKESQFVFIDDQAGPHYGKPYHVLRKFLPGLCKRAGVKPFGFHALRRFVASILADRHKVSSKTVQRFLRHKSVHTTELYIQNINKDLHSVAALLEISTPESTPNKKEGNKDIG